MNPRCTDYLAVAAMQMPGSRARQEDSLVVQEMSCPDGGRELLLVIGDGMGGAVGGAIASGLVCDTFAASMNATVGRIQGRLQAAMEAANSCLAERVRAEHHLSGMGSTVVAAVVSAGNLYWLSVGDSPLWLFRGSGLRRLNVDHSMREVLGHQVKQGMLSKEQAQRDVTRHALLSVLCGTPPPMIDLAPEPCSLQADDQLLLASDGLETLSESEIAAVLERTAAVSPEEGVKMLLAEVGQRHSPSQDNASAILLKVGWRQADQQFNIRLPEANENIRSSRKKWWLPFSLSGR